MSRVLLTGAAGHIGRATAARLIVAGWDVRAIDLAPDAEIAGAEYRRCDILNYADVLAAMQGCDAVIHMAAIRNPGLAPGHDVFRVNAAGTFNVFEAAAAVGIRRVVQASSINALGCYYNLGDFAPQYFPIDEAHPSLTTDPYSLSKVVGESIGAYYWRRDGLSSIALRFPGVPPPDYLQTEGYRQRRAVAHRALDELVSLPEAEQQARLAAGRERALDFRAGRPLEFAASQNGAGRLNAPDDPLLTLYAHSRYDLWAWIDVRDAAQACVKGIGADFVGDHVLYVADQQNVIGYDAQTLIRVFYPSARELRGDLSGAASLISSEKARQLIGFAPEYSLANAGGHWRTA